MTAYFEMPNLPGALCATVGDPDAFYSDHGTEGVLDTRWAKRVCSECSVRTACLDWAVSNQEKHGVWGGLTADERDQLRVRRGVRPCRSCHTMIPLEPYAAARCGPCREKANTARSRRYESRRRAGLAGSKGDVA